MVDDKDELTITKGAYKPAKTAGGATPSPEKPRPAVRNMGHGITVVK